MNETQERHLAGLPLRRFANPKQFKEIGLKNSLKLCFGTGFPRWFFFHLITLSLAIPPFAALSASYWGIDYNNDLYSSLFSAVSSKKVPTSLDVCFLSKQTFTYFYWGVLLALFFFCNLFKCGRFRFALFGPRRSVYFRRYIFLVATWTLSDGGCFLGLVYLDTIYRRRYCIDSSYLYQGNSCILVHPSHYIRTYVLSIILTYVTPRGTILAANPL